MRLLQGSEEFVTELAISEEFKGVGSSIYAVRSLSSITRTPKLESKATHSKPQPATLMLNQVLDKLKISRDSLLQVPSSPNPSARCRAAASPHPQPPTLDDRFGESTLVIKIMPVAPCRSFKAILRKCQWQVGASLLSNGTSGIIDTPTGAADILSACGGIVQRHAATSAAEVAAPVLRLNLPVLPDLANSTQLKEAASVEPSSSQPPPPLQQQQQHIIELQEFSSADDTSDQQSLLSPHLTRDYTKLESTQINESNILRGGDRLIISAKLENLQHLRHLKGKGLSIGDSVINGFHDVDSEFVELVVSHRCPHIGKAINSRLVSAVCGSQDVHCELRFLDWRLCEMIVFAGTFVRRTISAELSGRGAMASACLTSSPTPSLLQETPCWFLPAPRT